MDELEIIEHLNRTNATVWELEKNLSSRQILCLFISIIGIFGNAFLIFMLRRNDLQKINLYFTIISWNVANILFITNLLYFVVVPSKWSSFVVSEILYFSSVTMITIPVLHATIILFDYILKSGILYRYIIYLVWTVSTIVTLLTTIYLTYETDDITLIVGTFGVIKLICLIMLVVRTLIYCTHNKEETYNLRILMSSLCIIPNVLYWTVETINFFTQIPLLIIDILMLLIFLNGFINLILLICLDPQIKLLFLQFFNTGNKYLGVHFAKKNSMTDEMLETE